MLFTSTLLGTKAVLVVVIREEGVMEDVLGALLPLHDRGGEGIGFADWAV